MSLPSAIFLDTCILDAAQYSLDSAQFVALKEATAGRGIRLALPRVTKAEILRHIDERASLAAAELETARREAPFLRRVSAIPQSRAEKAALKASLVEQVVADWNAFQAHFGIEELGYDGVNLAELMMWYEAVRPPFGLGEKAKEFPDAVALLALRHYADTRGEIVAVVSQDQDFKKACLHTPNLRYFDSVESLSQHILAETAARFAIASAMASAALPLVRARIIAEFWDRAFSHASDPNGNGVVEEVEVADVVMEPGDLKVIQIGPAGFVVSFSALVQYSAWVKYDDPDSWVTGDPEDEVWYLHTCAGNVGDEAEISGTIHFTVGQNWGGAAAIEFFVIDDDEIEITTEAPRSHDDDGDAIFDEPGSQG